MTVDDLASTHAFAQTDDAVVTYNDNLIAIWL